MKSAKREIASTLKKIKLIYYSQNNGIIVTIHRYNSICLCGYTYRFIKRMAFSAVKITQQLTVYATLCQKAICIHKKFGWIHIRGSNREIFLF